MDYQILQRRHNPRSRWVRILLQRMKAAQMIKKFLAFHGTLNVITVSTEAPRLDCSLFQTKHNGRCHGGHKDLQQWIFTARGQHSSQHLKQKAAPCQLSACPWIFDVIPPRDRTCNRPPTKFNRRRTPTSDKLYDLIYVQHQRDKPAPVAERSKAAPRRSIFHSIYCTIYCTINLLGQPRRCNIIAQ